MDTCLVCERIRADDRLGRCNSNAGDGLNHAACAVDLGGFDVAADAEVVGTGLERHDALLHGGVACTLADAVDGAFNLVDTGFNARERVCNRHAEVVVHMTGQNDVFDAGGVLAQILDACGVLLRDHVADGIRNIDGGSACLDSGFDNAAQEVEVSAGRILGGEFDIRAEAFRVGNAVRDGFDDLVRGHLELVLHMYRAGSNKGMDTGRFSAADRIVGCLDVLVYAARKRADGRAANGISDCCDRSCITGRRSCKAGLDDVDLERFELLCDLNLLVEVHGAAGRLLAVAQSRVKNLNRSTHGFLSSPSGNVCRTGTKKAPSLNSALRDEAKAPRYHSCCRRKNCDHSKRIHQCAVRITADIPFHLTGTKGFQRTVPGRVSLHFDAALHRTTAL